MGIETTGVSLPVFFVLSLLAVFCAGMIGHTAAISWGHRYWAIFYAIFLCAAYRFLIYGPNQGALLDWAGFLVSSLLLIVVAQLCFQVAKAQLVLRQYPWRYERAYLIFWRKRIPGQPD